MNINYDYYKIFYYVGKYKNLSLVAKLLNSNQPNLSKLMNKLEMQMGCKLMIRSNRGITLTREGEKLFQHVSIAYNELRAAEAELSAENDLSAGVICIGVTDAAFQSVVIDSIKAFKSEYPNINISIFSYTTNQATDALKSGVIDFAVVNGPVYKKNDFNQTPLLRYKEVVVDSAINKHWLHDEIKLKELLKLPIIGHSSYTSSADFHNKYFADHGIEWNPDIGISTCNVMIPLVKAGLGVAFVPEFFASPVVAEGSVRVIAPDGFTLPKREILLLEDQREHCSIAARKLLQQIKRDYRPNAYIMS